MFRRINGKHCLQITKSLHDRNANRKVLVGPVEDIDKIIDTNKKAAKYEKMVAAET